MKSNDNVIKRIRQKTIDKEIILNPVIPEEVIRQFEQQNEIIFPEEFVEFYTLVGNGGIMIDEFPLKRFEKLRIDIEQVRQEFPFSEHWIWEVDPEGGNRDDVVKGNIELIDIGDAQTWNLIINGKERGKMWFFVDVGIQPCAPGRDFFSWYEYWLDGNDDYFSAFYT